MEKFRFSHTQQSTARLHLGGVQRRCVWAVGRLGVAACLACVAAVAVDRQARQSCRVWRGGVNISFNWVDSGQVSLVYEQALASTRGARWCNEG